jgi:hypothetical protein
MYQWCHFPSTPRSCGACNLTTSTTTTIHRIKTDTDKYLAFYRHNSITATLNLSINTNILQRLHNQLSRIKSRSSLQDKQNHPGIEVTDTKPRIPSYLKATQAILAGQTKPSRNSGDRHQTQDPFHLKANQCQPHRTNKTIQESRCQTPPRRIPYHDRSAE